jgi:adenosylmethionine-8-amino-7-oxononanoate aminotransferase
MATVPVQAKAFSPADTPRHSYALQRSLNGRTPVAIHADGLYVYTDDGRKLIDAGMAPASAALGHCHPKVVEAVRRQVGALHFVHGARFTSPPLEALAEKLIARAPAGLARAYFSLSGSDAMEATLKLARQYFIEAGEPQRMRFIGRRHEYHGATVGALSVGGNAYRRRISQGLLLDVPLVSPPYAYRYRRADESDDQYARRLADELDREIRGLGPETVAAFVAETVNGTTLGCVAPVPGYFRYVREVCDRHGVLLIMDEVLCGIGYTGTMHACEPEGVVPDLLAIGKGLGAGHQPISGVLVHERIVNAMMAGSGGFNHGQTYEGHAVGCAAALAVQEVIEEDHLLAVVTDRGRKLDRLLRERLGAHPNVGDIRGRGLLRAVEFVEDRDTKKPFDAGRKIAYRIREAAASRGMLCFGGGGDLDGAGDHIMITPPFIVSDAMLETIVRILGEAVDDVLPAAGGRRPATSFA